MLSDGSGHGPRAAEASQLAAEQVQAHASLALEVILAKCGAVLRGTRGVALALLRLDLGRREMEFVSVGNVELRADSRDRIAPVCSPGVVGRPVRKIRRFSYPLHAGDRLVMFTDGISRRFELGDLGHLSAQDAATQILQDFGVRHDDASCLVIDPLPRSPTDAGPAAGPA